MASTFNTVEKQGFGSIVFSSLTSRFHSVFVQYCQAHAVVEDMGREGSLGSSNQGFHFPRLMAVSNVEGEAKLCGRQRRPQKMSLCDGHMVLGVPLHFHEEDGVSISEPPK